MATRLAGKRHPEQGQIGGHEKRDTGAASQRPARSWPSGRPLEARSNPGPREMTAAIVRKDGRHRIRLIARLPRALKKGTGALRSLSPFDSQSEEPSDPLQHGAMGAPAFGLDRLATAFVDRLG